MARPNTALLLTGGVPAPPIRSASSKTVAELYPATSASPSPFCAAPRRGPQHHGAGLPPPASTWGASWSGSGDASRPTTSSAFIPASCCGAPLYRGRPVSSRPKQPRLPPVRQRPLRRLLDQLIDYHRIDDNILYGSLGPSPSRPPTTTTASPPPSSRAEPSISPGSGPGGAACALLTSDHLLASSALPFVFFPPPHRRSLLRGWLHPPAEPAQPRHPPGAGGSCWSPWTPPTRGRSPANAI